ncbi:hypothetical protein SCHPADRAFT_930385 [Schizopora paradoxa]|uniref:Protein kinase domain-containing protein n=1 Tax=Schizopora paradoxa TaxID=27342 RepID=A0A0H2RGK0_9AGAM|nr:hypothetical protein SCHPADRAFT_930385 [Schizopora paradoxa]
MHNIFSLVDSVFPDAIIEISSQQIDEALGMDALRQDDEWVLWPRSETKISEADAAKFINTIRNVVEEHYLPKGRPRYCSSMFRNTPVNHPEWKYKPDVILVGHVMRTKERDSIGWIKIKVVLEVKENADLLSDGISQCARYAQTIFDAQPGRRFVPIVLIIGAEVIFFIFDRSGMIASERISVHDNPRKFLRLIVGLLFAKEEHLGFEHTVTKKGDKQYIETGGVEYEVECIYHEFGIKGRGTVCYRGTSIDQSVVVIKDAWVDVCREETEVGILTKLNGRGEKELCTPDGVRVIPQIVSHEILKTKRPGETPGQLIEVDATTAIFRGDLVVYDGDKPKWAWTDETKTEKCEIRRLCRITMKPFGKELCTFTSKKELVTAFGDIIYAVKILHRNGFIHRDISYRNILLYQHNGVLRGLLIDYDYAISIKRSTSEAVAERTGTLPFMAFDRMKKNPKFPHSYFHDLESIFYVICWTCILFRGRGYENKRQFETEKKPYFDTVVAAWNGDGRHNSTRHDIGCRKQGNVANGCIDDILVDFSLYFNDIKDFVQAYADLIFVNDCNFLNPRGLKKFEEKKIMLDKRFELETPPTDEEKKDQIDEYSELPIQMRPPFVTIDSLRDLVEHTSSSIAVEEVLPDSAYRGNVRGSTQVRAKRGKSIAAAAPIDYGISDSEISEPSKSPKGFDNQDWLESQMLGPMKRKSRNSEGSSSKRSKTESLATPGDSMSGAFDVSSSSKGKGKGRGARAPRIAEPPFGRNQSSILELPEDHPDLFGTS